MIGYCLLKNTSPMWRTLAFGMNEDVGIGVGRRYVRQIDLFAVQVERQTGSERLRRQLAARDRLEVQAEQIVRPAQALLRVLVGDDTGAGVVKIAVVVGVIEVPVRVDDRLHRLAPIA